MSEQTGKTSNERMTLKKVFEDRKLEPSFVNNLTKRLFPDDCKEETDPTQWPEIRLTKLQEEVFNDPMFWETKPPQNLIFQGATSAGKTLLGEVAAYIHLKNFYQSHRARSKVVFLVPLKVLVTARYKALSTDFKNINVGNEKELRIYASSSDYQEYDGDILNGSFEIAVIVYEKFFAMLAQQPDFKEHCGLVIIDELQMLSSNDRGPKLEFALLQLRNTHTRIIGLLTSDCTVEAVSKWLRAKLISCDSRPVGVFANGIDYITGEQKSIYLSGENEPENFEKPKCENLPEVDDQATEYGRTNAKYEQRKQKYLLSLLSRPGLLRDDFSGDYKKILIFVASKSKAVQLAQTILKSGLLPRAASPGVKTLTEELEPHRDEEEDVPELLNGLIEYGIAVHHSSFPAVVREAIENGFRSSSGCLKIIVCTETLMMGVNLPTDTVILYDYKVYRAREGKPIPLTKQEYHNYIGRAGRLGLTGRQYGSSYLFTDNMRNFSVYHSQEKDEVISAFEPKMKEIEENGSNKNIQLLAMELAPYYLNLMASSADNFQQSDLCGYIQNSMYVYTQQKDGRLSENWSSKIDLLSEQILAYWVKPCHFTVQQSGLFLETQYKMTQDGRSFAPYAIMLRSSYDIQQFLKGSGKQIQRYHLQVRENHTSSSDRLLDLFYVLCKTPDISGNPALTDFGDDLSKRSQQGQLDLLVRNYLKKAKASGNLLFEDSPLLNMIENEDINPSEDLRAVMRAILLRLWTQGMGIRYIRKQTKFNIRMSSGDFARISEACAYLLEAMSTVMRGKFAADRIDISYYQLSTCVKYGVPQQLVSLANLHTYGVSRNMLLTIKNRASTQKVKIEDFILYNTWKDLRYKHLQEQLKKRREVNNYERQLNFIRDGVPAELAVSFNELYRLDNMNEHWQQVLQDTLEAMPHREDEKAWADVGSDLILHFTKDASKAIRMVLIENPEKWTPKDGWENYTTILVLANASKTTGFWSEALRNEDRLIITLQMLGMMIACAIAEAEINAPVVLQQMLSDLCGKMIQGLDEDIYFNSINRIRPLVKAYIRNDCGASASENEVLIHSFVESPNYLSENEKIKTQLLPWSETLQKPVNIVSLYHPAMENSRNAKNLLASSKVVLHMKDQIDQLDCSIDKDRVIEISDTSENVLYMIDQMLESNTDEYRYTLGISYRDQYETQISELYKHLKTHISEEKIWKMKEAGTKKDMLGDSIDFRLQDIFKSCQYFIIGDTEDYLDSYYTKFVEYGVIRSRLKKLTAQGKESPVFLVRIAGIEGCQRLEELLGTFYYDLKDGGEQVAQGIWQKICPGDANKK